MKKEPKNPQPKKVPVKNNYVCMTENAVNNAYDGDVSSVIAQPQKKQLNKIAYAESCKSSDELALINGSKDLL